MDTELLVDNRIEDGQKLVAELVNAGFDVSVAFWVKTSEEGLWFLYIGSTSVELAKIGDAYRTLYACLTKIPDPWVSLSQVKLIQASNPIAREAIAARDRHPGRLPVRFQGNRLGTLFVEEAYIYPRVGGPMTPEEIRQTLFGIANRPAGTRLQPSVVTLRNGSTITAFITGLHMQLPDGGFTIQTVDPVSNASLHIMGDDVVNIR